MRSREPSFWGASHRRWFRLRGILPDIYRFRSLLLLLLPSSCRQLAHERSVARKYCRTTTFLTGCIHQFHRKVQLLIASNPSHFGTPSTLKMAATGTSKSALIVVDMQEDFCPPVRPLASANPIIEATDQIRTGL